MSSNFNIKLNRSRSADSLSVSSNHYVKRDKSYDRFYDYFNHDNHLQSDLSQEIFVVIDDHSDTSSIDKENQDSGVTNTSKFDETSLSSLDRKINKLNRKYLFHIQVHTRELINQCSIKLKSLENWRRLIIIYLPTVPNENENLILI